MNPRYRATARRHRLLFVLVILLCAMLGLLTSLGSQKLYRSTASLWSDSASATSFEAVGALPPAAQEQTMLTELLTTHNFVHDVARNSPLQTYLEKHTSTGSTPTAVLKRFLKGPPTLDDRIATALSAKRVTSTVHGQHILEIAVDEPDPVLAQQTLRALIKKYIQQRSILAESALKSAQAQVASASRSLAEARLNLDSYVRTHPGLPSNDLERRALSNAYRSGLLQLRTATSSMNQALGAVAGGSGLESTLRVYDPPLLPAGATTGKKRVVELTIAGAFLGGLISFFLIMLMSREGSTGPSPNGRPATMPEPSPNGGHSVSEHDRAADHLPHEERRASEIRRE